MVLETKDSTCTLINSLAVKNREFQICKEGAEKSLDVDLT